MSRAVALIAAALVFVAACTTGGGAVSTGGSSPGGTTASPGGSAPSGISLPSSITDQVVADAANRLGVDPTEVTIILARAETFPDGSLGCPRPGEMYTQALVEGYHVVVEANGIRRDYRGNGQRQFRICENP